MPSPQKRASRSDSRLIASDATYQSSASRAAMYPTVDDIRDDVVLYHRGVSAAWHLSDAGLGADELLSMMRDIGESDAALERLVVRCTPLVHSLAKAEARRRGMYSLLAEFQQEGMKGLMKGLARYDITKTIEGSKPSAYLGQWITDEINRGIEKQVNVLAVPTETSRKFNRIMAVRNRLTVELGRTPTDSEVIAASRERRQTRKLGKRDSPAHVLTQQELDEARKLKPRLGALARFDRVSHGVNGDAGDNGDRSMLETAQPIDLTRPALMSSPEHVIFAAGLHDIVCDVFDELQLGKQHRAVISRRYGLTPDRRAEAAPEATTLKVAAYEANVSEQWAEDVCTAFVVCLTSLGGPLHRVMDRSTEPEDLNELGLGWLLNRLPHGESHQYPSSTPPILTSPPPRGQLPPRVVSRGEPVIAEFRCPTHHTRTFCGYYRSARAIPAQRDCPSCGRPSPFTTTVTNQGENR